MMNNGRTIGEKSPFYTRKQVLEIVPFGRTTMFALINENKFPKPKQLGERSVAWSKKEVDEWVEKILTT